MKYVQSLMKYFGKSKKIKQNWTRPENFDIRFSVIYGNYCQILVVGGETRR